MTCHVMSCHVMAVGKLVYNNFCLAISARNFGTAFLHSCIVCIKNTFIFLRSNASDRVPGAFNVLSYRTLHDRFCSFLIKESDFWNVYVSRYIFYLGIHTARNRLKILLKFILCNFLSICFPTTHRPLCSTAVHIHNNNNNNNNSLSLCTLTQHITPC
jgi:hypothetical protein